MMNTNVKVILAAVGIALLASPVMAASSHRHSTPSAISNAYGWGNQIHIDDAVHVAFPQQGGGV